jgi:hypothetical protein
MRSRSSASSLSRPTALRRYGSPQQHSEYEWLPYEVALARVYYRGLKDGLRSAHDYIVGVDNPAPELRLR